LNVLRLIILDAPLATEVGPIVGDAIVSALLGYNDPTWEIRNSSTMVFAAVMLRAIDADKNASNTDRTSNNAITITELFRRYPSLSSFLQSVMKTSMAALGDSRVFPILLLLSRVQPIADSGTIAAEQTSPIIPIALECLKNRQLSIRSAAARAVANLCSGDQLPLSSSSVLLEECTKVLSLGGKGLDDWNAVHGSLLAINALTRSSSLARRLFQEMEISKQLLRFVSWEKDGPHYPPCCIVTAFETLVDIAVEMKTAGLRPQIEAACQHMLRLLSASEAIIGSANLAATVASGLCKLTLASLWNFPADSSDFERMLGLFQCDLIDVRLAAVKAFKKDIYKSIDRLLLLRFKDDGRSAQYCKQILIAVARMLLQALHAELERDESPNDHVGTHPPTVRRLSRCYLECVCGYKKLIQDSNEDFSSILPKEEGLLWKISLLVTDRETSTSESNGENLLSANAAELMAIDISAMLRCVEEHNIQLDEVALRKIETFVQVVARLVDPYSSWRSRHSAAVAIETSQILIPRAKLIGMEESRKRLVLETLRMLQDSDCDVRDAASRASRQIFNEAKSSEFSSTTLPQLILEGVYPTVHTLAHSNDEKETIDRLLRTILGNCNGILRTIAQLQDEMQHSQCGLDSSSSSLLNVAATRKIFEDEDPNPFEERLLANMLAARTLLEIMRSVPNSQGQEDLLSLCRACLDVISSSKTDDIVHDITRFPSTFVSLHSLILASAVLLHSGRVDTAGLCAVARSIVENSSQVHPEIMKILRVLVETQNTNGANRLDINNCFFLLTKDGRLET
jgi:hypothetical protein